MEYDPRQHMWNPVTRKWRLLSITTIGLKTWKKRGAILRPWIDKSKEVWVFLRSEKQPDPFDHEIEEAAKLCMDNPDLFWCRERTFK